MYSGPDTPHRAPRAGLRARAPRAHFQTQADALLVVGVAAAFDVGGHCFRHLGVAQQEGMHAARQELLELPGIGVDGVGAVPQDRQFDHDGRGRVARGRGPAVQQPLHEFVEGPDVEQAVLHVDANHVGPGAGRGLAAGIGEFRHARAEDGLPGFEQVNGLVDGHGVNQGNVGGRRGDHHPPQRTR